MNFWKLFTDRLDDEPDTGLSDPFSEFDVNPANGLPMIQGVGIDIEGNPLGTDDSNLSGMMDWSDD